MMSPPKSIEIQAIQYCPARVLRNHSTPEQFRWILCASSLLLSLRLRQVVKSISTEVIKESNRIR